MEKKQQSTGEIGFRNETSVLSALLAIKPNLKEENR
jgi:hypothetical protein